MVQQKAVVSQLAMEAEECERAHANLVVQLHQSTCKGGADAEPALRCTLGSILDGYFTKQLSIDPSEIFGSTDEYEMSAEDQEQLDR
eukprot:7410560-Pyramimonas_sp.AAC.1